MRFVIASALIAVTAACSPPSPQPQPDEMETVNATRFDPAAPAAGEEANFAEGNITPAEREESSEPGSQQPEQLVARFANSIVQRRFDEALRTWLPQAAGFTAEQMAAKFERFETIQAEVGEMGTSQGDQQQVQLTLTGTREDGTAYSLTGPVTVVRAGGTGAAAQQGWQIARVVLTSDAQAADALIDQ